MRLRFSPTSPFVRKVTVTAIELGLDDQIEHVATNVWADDTDIERDNPLRKVPALVTDHGTFVDSGLICRYLDAQAGNRLFPAADDWATWRLYQLADGIIEAGVARTVQTARRPPEARYEPAVAREDQRIRDTLDVLEAEGGFDAEKIDIATITLGCALAYLDLRCPHIEWRNGHPRLAAFLEAFSARPSMQATVPPAV